MSELQDAYDALDQVETELRQTRAELAAARELLNEASAEIEASLAAEYDGKQYEYPDELRRFRRDMDLPRRIRQALARHQQESDQ